MDRVDLAVIGGGITGVGIARLAARNGLSVALFERADLASGASSATSHMLHGGLRYLEHGQFALVRESLAERTAVSRMAPGLARPRRFLMPFYRGDRRPGWMVRTGLWLYDSLAGGRGLEPHQSFGAAAALALEPDLEPEGLLGGAIYGDVVMDDARITVSVAMDAAAHGAAIHSHTEVTGARPGAEGGIELIVRDALEGGERSALARYVVIACGAWSDSVRTRLLRALEPGRPDPARLLRPTRGVHLVFPALTRGHGITAFAPRDGRVVFVVPFGEWSIVGTTETEVVSSESPDAWSPSLEEVRYLREALARLLPSQARRPALALMAGVRPLAASDGTLAAASREHRVTEDGDLFTIVGGKYTGFRPMAHDIVARVMARLHRSARIDDPATPLPPWLAAEAGAEALAAFAVERAFARRLEDVVRRRSLLWLAPDGGRIAAPLLAEALGRRLGWDATRTREELRAFHARLDDDERLLHEAYEDHAPRPA
ncbi:MAG: FAD-dependent oxidoreductase [Candidatus Eisenbacteria bacterium]|uniref:FAD-dependent oxidoreductase n=1 Tax=Eiseniibacteriota bacterium TaxID=2212470 RepID=A0A849T354_UNCEI|nr:FAD-dependent oxidoreductase [Candidatus Eisenbacteria bacterium]